MKTMGIRELKARMSEAIQDVQAGETIEVTNHGQVVAMLVPVRRKPNEEQIKLALASMDSMVAEMSSYVSGPTDVARLISDMRR